MIRGGECVAHVCTLPNGKCVVSWPTSIIVYDSEAEARAVHIEHMGGRGELTRFTFFQASPAAERGWTECYQDRCEGVPFRIEDGAVVPPDYIPIEQHCGWVLGYTSMLMELFGPKWESELAAGAEGAPC